MFVTKTLEDLLLNEFKDIFKEVYKDEKNINIEEKILESANTAIKDVLEDKESIYAKDFTIALKKIYERRKSKRYRLMTKVTKPNSKKPISIVHEDAELIYEVFNRGEISIGEKYGITKIDTKDEAISKITDVIIKQLEEWKSNKDSYIYNLKYFSKLRLIDQKKSLDEDIQLYTYKYISQDLSYLKQLDKTNEEFAIKENSFLNSRLVFFPNHIGGTPFANDATTKLEWKKIDNLLVDSYDLGNSIVYKTTVAPAILKDVAFYKAYHTCFNIRTRDVLDCLFANVGPDFIKNGKVDIKIKKLLDYTYSSDSIKNYEAIKSELYKLRDFNITIRNEKTNDFSYFSLFSNMDVDETYAHVTFGEVIKEQFINNQVTILYKDTLERLKHNHVAKILILPLQNKRMTVFYQADKKLDITDIEVQLSLLWFKEKVRFANKRQTKQIKQIKDALDEIQNTNEIIEKWRYSSIEKCFYIKFKKIKNIELEELFKINGIFLNESNYEVK